MKVIDGEKQSTLLHCEIIYNHKRFWSRAPLCQPAHSGPNDPERAKNQSFRKCYFVINFKFAKCLLLSCSPLLLPLLLLCSLVAKLFSNINHLLIWNYLLLTCSPLPLPLLLPLLGDKTVHHWKSPKSMILPAPLLLFTTAPNPPSAPWQINCPAMKIT